MSTVNDRKESQGYTPKVIPNTCSNCKNCVAVMGDVLQYIDPYRWSAGTHMVSAQVSQKCGVGEFAVKKTASCKLWQEA